MLGEVDGFIVDVNDRRPYYVVVTAGNWFKSKYVLLPVGQTIFDAAIVALTWREYRRQRQRPTDGGAGVARVASAQGAQQ